MPCVTLCEEGEEKRPGTSGGGRKQEGEALNQTPSVGMGPPTRRLALGRPCFPAASCPPDRRWQCIGRGNRSQGLSRRPGMKDLQGRWEAEALAGPVVDRTDAGPAPLPRSQPGSGNIVNVYPHNLRPSPPGGRSAPPRSRAAPVAGAGPRQAPPGIVGNHDAKFPEFLRFDIDFP
jgi:hypothetical protein